MLLCWRAHFQWNLPLFGYQQHRIWVFHSACWYRTWKAGKVSCSYVGLGYIFIHTKEFNSKQGCITINPRKFLVGWGTTNYNQLRGIDLNLALHKHFWDSHDRRWMDFSLIAIFIHLESNNNKSRFLWSCLYAQPPCETCRFMSSYQITLSRSVCYKQLNFWFDSLVNGKLFSLCGNKVRYKPWNCI